MKPLSKHQLEVLAAMAAIIERSGVRYVSFEQVGYVVASGSGGTIPQATIDVLEERGLISPQTDDLPREVRQLLLCGCHAHRWRLTVYGEEEVARRKVVWDEESLKRLDWGAKAMASYARLGLGETEDDEPEGGSYGE